MDELLEEFLLRLTPEDPAVLEEPLCFTVDSVSSTARHHGAASPGAGVACLLAVGAGRELWGLGLGAWVQGWVARLGGAARGWQPPASCSRPGDLVAGRDKDRGLVSVTRRERTRR